MEQQVVYFSDSPLPPNLSLINVINVLIKRNHTRQGYIQAESILGWSTVHIR